MQRRFNRWESDDEKISGLQTPVVAAGKAFVGTPLELAIVVCQAGDIGSTLARSDLI